MQQHFFDRGLMTVHRSGDISLSLRLDSNRCISVIYLQNPSRTGTIPPTTTVSVESYNPEISLPVLTERGDGTFYKGVMFAYSLIFCLELMREDELERMTDEMFPETHAATQAIANARAALMTVRAEHNARRAG